MNERQRDLLVNSTSGMIALATCGLFVPIVGEVVSGLIFKRLLGKEGMESDSAHFDEDSREAIKRATAEILGKQPV